MNRKAAVNATENEMTFLFAGVVILTTTFLTFLMTTLEIEEAKTAEHERLADKLRSARLLYSTDCFALVQNDRPYPGVVDEEKITDQRIGDCLERPNGDPPPVKANLYVSDDFKANATTSSWTATPSTTLNTDSYTVSVNKTAIGILEVYHK